MLVTGNRRSVQPECRPPCCHFCGSLFGAEQSLAMVRQPPGSKEARNELKIKHLQKKRQAAILGKDTGIRKSVKVKTIMNILLTQ